MKLNRKTIVAIVVSVAMLVSLCLVGCKIIEEAEGQTRADNETNLKEPNKSILVVLPEDFYTSDGYDNPNEWLADLVDLRGSWEGYVDNQIIYLGDYFPTEKEEELRDLENKILNARSIQDALTYGEKITNIIKDAENKKIRAELITFNETPLDPSITPGMFKNMGIIEWGGWKYSYYSEKVLPGGGLSIPGRHVDDRGFIRDADGFICVANERGDGFVCESPWGMCKVYDKGTYGNQIDVYVSW